MSGEPEDESLSPNHDASSSDPPVSGSSEGGGPKGVGLDLSGFQMVPDWVSGLEQGGGAAASSERFSDYDEDSRERRRGPRDRRGGGFPRDRRPGMGGDRDRDRGQRPERRQGGPEGPRGERGRPDRRRGGERTFGGGRREFPDRPGQRGGPRQRPQEPETVPGLQASLRPQPEGAAALAQMIRRSGRTFSLLELANLVIGGRDRYEVVFSPDPKSLKDGQSSPMLVRCRLDNSVWLGRDEAIHHLVHSKKLLSRYYRREEVPIEPPKGNFSGVAVCGMCGTVLGPPNHHSYQEAVHRLHREKYSHLPFERFRSRIHIDSSAEAIERWKAEQSHAEEFVYFPGGVPAADEPREETPATGAESAAVTSPPDVAEEGKPDEPEIAESTASGDDGGATGSGAGEGVAESVEPDAAETAEPDSTTASEDSPSSSEPSESDGGEAAGSTEGEVASEATESGASEGAPLRIRGIALLERHVRDNLASEVLEEVSTAIVPGNIPARHLSGPLFGVLRSTCERVRRSPAMLIAPICDVLGSEGLKFFRRDGKRLYTAASKPRRMPDELQLSERVRGIVAYVREHPGTKVMELLGALAPAPAGTTEAPKESAQETASSPSMATTAEPVPSASPAAPEPPPSSDDESAPPAPGASEDASAPAPAPAPASESRDQRTPGKDRKKSDRKKAPPEARSIPLTDQQLALLADLRWLIGEGFVLEFSSSRLELASGEQTPAASSRPAKPGPATASPEASKSTREPNADPSNEAAVVQPPADAPSESVAAEPPATGLREGEPSEAIDEQSMADAPDLPPAAGEASAATEAVDPAAASAPDAPKPSGD